MLHDEMASFYLFWSISVNFTTDTESNNGRKSLWELEKNSL